MISGAIQETEIVLTFFFFGRGLIPATKWTLFALLWAPINDQYSQHDQRRPRWKQGSQTQIGGLHRRGRDIRPPLILYSSIPIWPRLSSYSRRYGEIKILTERRTSNLKERLIRKNMEKNIWRTRGHLFTSCLPFWFWWTPTFMSCTCRWPQFNRYIFKRE